MDQFAKTPLLVNPFELVRPRSIAICHHAIMSPYYTGKKTKANDPLTIFVFEAFIIYQRDFFVEYGAEKFSVSRLLLFCVGKKQVSFFGDQPFNWYLFDSEKNITIRYIFS